MNRMQKNDLVEKLRSHLDQASLMLVVNLSGLNVNDTTNLRTKMRANGAYLKVLKNTLALRAVKEQPYEGISDWFKGEASIAYSQDPVIAAKILCEFSEKENDKVQVLGGYLDGKLLQKSDLISLSKLPSKDELRAKLLATISAPAQKIAMVIKEPLASLARVVSAKQ